MTIYSRDPGDEDNPFDRAYGDSRPGAPPVIPWEDFARMFGLFQYAPTPEEAREAERTSTWWVVHHSASLVEQTNGLVGLAEMLFQPSSETGRTLDIRAVQDKVENIKLRCTAIEALCAELNKRPV
jgi:hypothetical protein